MVYFVRGRNGGAFYLNDLDVGWDAKHECNALRKSSRPRIATSTWRKGGWTPLCFVGERFDERGQILSAVALTDEAAFEMRVLGDGQINSEHPAFYRLLDELVGTLEVDYLDDTGELSGKRALAERLPETA